MASGHQRDLPVYSGSFPYLLEVDLNHLPVKIHTVFAVRFMEVESLVVAQCPLSVGLWDP